MRDCRFGLRFLIASSHFFDPNGKKLYLNWKARDCRQNLLRIRFSLMRTETPETLEGWGRFDPNGKTLSELENARLSPKPASDKVFFDANGKAPNLRGLGPSCPAYWSHREIFELLLGLPQQSQSPKHSRKEARSPKVPWC